MITGPPHEFIFHLGRFHLPVRHCLLLRYRPEVTCSGYRYRTMFSNVRAAFVHLLHIFHPLLIAVSSDVIPSAPRLPPIDTSVCILDTRQVISNSRAVVPYRSSLNIEYRVEWERLRKDDWLWENNGRVQFKVERQHAPISPGSSLHLSLSPRPRHKMDSRLPNIFINNTRSRSQPTSPTLPQQRVGLEEL